MEEMFELGMYCVIGIAFISVLASIILHYLAQRSNQHTSELSHQTLLSMHSLGVNAIIGANEIKIIDESLEKKEEAKS